MYGKIIHTNTKMEHAYVMKLINNIGTKHIDRPALKVDN